MSKPIPAHIMAKAREAVSEVLGGKRSLDEFSTPIARAILAAVEEERAAAARLSEEKYADAKSSSERIALQAGMTIASAIRARKGN